MTPPTTEAVTAKRLPDELTDAPALLRHAAAREQRIRERYTDELIENIVITHEDTTQNLTAGVLTFRIYIQRGSYTRRNPLSTERNSLGDRVPFERPKTFSWERYITVQR